MLFRAWRIRTLLLFVVALLGRAESARAIEMGIDISHWQDTINWSQVTADPHGIKGSSMLMLVGMCLTAPVAVGTSRRAADRV